MRMINGALMRTEQPPRLSNETTRCTRGRSSEASASCPRIKGTCWREPFSFNRSYPCHPLVCTRLPGSMASATKAAAHFFGRDDDQRFRRGRPPLRPADAPHKGLVDLHPARQPIAVRPNHRAPQLVQPRPRGLLAAQAQHLLQRQGAGTGLRAGDGPHRAKPCRQRGSCVLKDRARRPRRLAAALGTLPQDCAHRPGCRCAAPRAAQAVRPPHLDEIGTTRLLGREARLELGERPWVLVHAAGHYRLGSPESSG
jgi:hypothetical protein